MPLTNSVRLGLLAFSTCLVTNCTSVPITSYPKLATLNPSTMDLADLELAVRMQDDFGIIQDSAILSVGLVHEETGDTIQRQFVLQENPEPLTDTLMRKQKAGYSILRFKMDPDTAAAATDYRAEVIARRDAEPGDQHEGTFSASVGFCMQPEGNPFIDPRMILFLRTAPDKNFFTMVKETKMPLPRDKQGKFQPCVTE